MCFQPLATLAAIQKIELKSRYILSHSLIYAHRIHSARIPYYDTQRRYWKIGSST